MSVFADSSAVVKLYAPETGSELLAGHDGFYVSEVARVEVPSAFWRKHRMGELSGPDCRLLTDQFEHDWHDPHGRFAVLPVGAELLERAAELVERRGLRTLDAIQLASAVRVHQVDPDCALFVTFDSDLGEAAADEGFALLR